MNWPEKDIPLQRINDPFLEKKGVEIFVLREDLTHPHISGNKWRKLKYNVLEAKAKGIETLVTTGGSHSNHIAATAAAGKLFGFKTIGIVRGYEAYRNNPTIRFAEKHGMEIRFLDKKHYLHFENKYLPELRLEIGMFFFIPMGGSNLNGVKGCIEINEKITIKPDVIATACGTGATMAGIIAGANPETNVLGFPAMKNGDFLAEEVARYLDTYFAGSTLPQLPKYELITDFHFGGFAKMNAELATFIMHFYHQHGIPLDGVYTGKMMYGLYQMISAGYFSRGTRIVAIHTGGLQGNPGLAARYKVALPEGV